jgi:glycosyltransferase involved in cell wall biosynthesis
VASAVGGVIEMVVHERTGLLVPPHDPLALGNAITRLLTDHPLADVLARTAHQMVEERFSVTAMVSAVSAIYEQGAAAVEARSREARTAA